MTNSISRLATIKNELIELLHGDLSDLEGTAYQETITALQHVQMALQSLSTPIEQPTEEIPQTVIPVEMDVLTESQANAINYVAERMIRDLCRGKVSAMVLYLDANAEYFSDYNSYKFMSANSWEINQGDHRYLATVTKAEAAQILHKSQQEYERYLANS